MFSTFTIKGDGTGRPQDPAAPPCELIIRSEDLRRLQDLPTGGCLIHWVEIDQGYRMEIEGTARENLERLRKEELDAIDRAQKVQQRQAAGLPGLPVPRGRTP